MSLLKKIFRRTSSLLRLAKTRVSTDYVVGFGLHMVPARERLVVSVRPDVAFRPVRLVIPSEVARHFQVVSVEIGLKNQIVSIFALPAVMFTEQAHGVHLGMDVASPTDNVSVTVVNTSDAEQNFQCGLVGPVA
jgi:hypothetical protein